MITRKKSFYAETNEKITLEVYQSRFFFATVTVTIRLLLLSHFLAYLGQFKSKSYIQGHPQKVKNKTFHLTPSLMGYIYVQMYTVGDMGT